MSKRSRASWVKLVREWRESGVSAKTFATRRRVNDRTLLWWSSKLKREAAMSEVRPLEFIEIARPPIASDGRFEVHLPNGRWLAVPAGFDAAALGKLLDVVEGRR